MATRTYSPREHQLAVWIANVALPNYIASGKPFQDERPHLGAAYRRLRERGNPPSNWYGITRLTSAHLSSDSGHLEYLKEREPPLYQDKLKTAELADIYVTAVRALSRAWRFEEAYGPFVIHALVSSFVTFGDKRLRGSSFLTRPTEISIQVKVNAFEHYESEEIEFFPNALRKFRPGKPIPSANWGQADDPQAIVLSISVRDLVDLQTFMPSIMQALSERTGLPIRKTRGDAYAKLPRNVRWFYKHHCEQMTPKAIADQELAGLPESVDESTVLKGIEQVRWLLRHPELHLS